jgi:hypothetical protein
VSDETPLIFGDAAAAELSRYPNRKWLRRKKKKARPPLTHCENCGAELTGRYCAQCGQAAIDYHRSFGSLMADAADAFFNLDERFLKTFALLLFKPWRLTIEFIEGKRARHVHPLRVYLIASVTFFLVINFLSRDTHFQARTKGDKAAFVFDDDSVKTAPSASPESSPVSPSSLASPTAVPVPTASPTPRHIFDEIEKESNPTGFGKWVEERAKSKIGPTGDRGDLFLRALIQNLAPMVLCCIPLFALVLKILYVFKRRFYIEHLIFALHTHAFVFLSTVVIIGIGFLLAWKAPAPFTPLVCTFLGIAVLVQLQIAIRKVYRQNWFATLFKFLLGSLIYSILLGIAFGVTAFLTLLLP